MKPVIIHTAMSQPALPTFLVMSALTIKIPEPIIEPATIMVPSNKPNEGLKETFWLDIKTAVWLRGEVNYLFQFESFSSKITVKASGGY